MHPKRKVLPKHNSNYSGCIIKPIQNLQNYLNYKTEFINYFSFHTQIVIYLVKYLPIKAMELGTINIATIS